MAGTHHTTDSRCPDCGNDEAIVRVKGNAISSVCTACRRVDVGPMLDVDDLLVVSADLAGHVFELAAVRAGDADPLRTMTVTRQVVEDNTVPELREWLQREMTASLSVELRLPVPPR